jgi:tetratricopeptide (TPR) repeat protein
LSFLRGRWVLWGALLVLFLPNLLALRVGFLRGKLARDFASYTELKASQPDPFTPLLQQGILALQKGREAEALELLRQAVRTRPFLLRYLLGPCKLSDLRWITAPRDLRGWIREISSGRLRADGTLAARDRETLDGLQQEISDYALCLFILAHLERRAGRAEEGCAWLSQIRYLERNPQRAAFWIGRIPAVDRDQAIKESLARLGDPHCFRDPIPWRMEDYGFGRFLVRLWLGWDILMGWEKDSRVRI